MENEQTKPKFVSLKVKWALGTAVGSLLISLVVVTVLFGSFTRDLLHQERRALKDNLVTISRQLGEVTTSNNLTSQQVNDLLQKRTAPLKGTDAGKVYQRPVIQGFSNSHLVVGIYNRDRRAN